MKEKDFEEKVREILKREGKAIPNQKEIFEKAKGQTKEISKDYHEGFKECRDFALNYYNSVLHSIYGVGIGLFASIFIQSIYGITNEIVKEEYLIFSNLIIAEFSGIILLMLGIFLYKDLKQVKEFIKKNKKSMRESKKMISSR